ncbi:hypothetical protein, partial [Salmonella enterica]|uniref:hypothetical protein n=1 Tax=Salmonella enterica TaxID=28901 RepID=UPI003298CA34
SLPEQRIATNVQPDLPAQPDPAPVVRPGPDPSVEPTFAQASPARWRHWALFLVQYGQSRLAALGVSLGLGLAVALLTLYLFAALADEVVEQ